MKKKHIFLFSILILTDFFSVVSFVNAFYCNLNFLDTDKMVYLIDENVKINASWELNYNINNEISYVQVQLFDSFDNNIWNSSEYTEIGFSEKNWSLDLQQLNINFSNYTNILYVTFFSFYFHIDTTNTICTYLETIKIKIIKRNPLCELIGYRDHIKYGECLYLKARFYDKSSESTRYLINHTIEFMISFDNLTRHKYTYTTNISGVIDLKISSLADLALGQNFLIFSILDHRVYNDTKFIYELFVDKNHLIIDIISYNDSLNEHEDLTIKLSYYYSVNQSLKPLANYSILLKIFDNETLTFINEYETDKFGILTIIIPQKLFNFDQKSQRFNINIIFNGTYYLKNKTLSLSLKINQEIYSKTKNTLQMSILSFVSILIIILIILSYIISEKKNRSDKLLTDLIIRY
ncbi:MAG: hypothetical protein V3V33_09635 [Candidatus Lokiarchaeia archaeon]